jgi:Xaa-Pro aminopeptidase
MTYRLPLSENRNRIDRLRAAMTQEGVDAAYITGATDIFYLSGVSAVSTERPAALVVPREGPVSFFGPRLEESHVRATDAVVEEVHTYFDYPGKVHPMERIAGFLRRMDLGKAVLWTDNPSGYGGLFGYRGPALSALLDGAELKPLGDLLVEMKTIKSPAEIELLRESARWGDRAMELLVSKTAPGAWDVEVEMRASLEASVELREESGDRFTQARWGSWPVHAGFRGQVGPDSSVPHAFATRYRIEKGHVLGTGASAQIGGYASELERCLVVGPPTDEQRRFFEVMVEAQDAALGCIAPGVPCAEVDNAAFAVLDKHNAFEYALHHTGHGRGLSAHEPPYLDRGNPEPLRSGMVLCIEPGLYVEGRYGFRHSDTVVVTEDGSERITLFPRDIEGCTVKV